MLAVLQAYVDNLNKQVLDPATNQVKAEWANLTIEQVSLAPFSQLQRSEASLFASTLDRGRLSAALVTSEIATQRCEQHHHASLVSVRALRDIGWLQAPSWDRHAAGPCSDMLLVCLPVLPLTRCLASRACAHVAALLLSHRLTCPKPLLHQSGDDEVLERRQAHPRVQ
jgi:hypothetical protein